MAHRLFTTTLANLRPGPTLHHEMRLDHDLSALTAAYRLLLAEHPTLPPAAPSLMIYSHPARVALPLPEGAAASYDPNAALQADPDETNRFVEELYTPADEVPGWVSAAMRYIDQRTLTAAQQIEAMPGQAASTSRMAGHRTVGDAAQVAVHRRRRGAYRSQQPARRCAMTLNRIIVTLQPTFDGGTQVKLEKATANFPQGQLAAPFVCQPPTTATWTVPDAVMEHGRTLRQALAQHPAIAQMLQLLAMAPATQVTPIYFYLQAPEAEQLYWEALYDDAQGVFLALDLRWPIGRIADALATQPALALLQVRGRAATGGGAIGARRARCRRMAEFTPGIDAARAAGCPSRCCCWWAKSRSTTRCRPRLRKRRADRRHGEAA
jgi:hypothetical protein